MSGILYGIGVGPGEPELLTLKAIRAIEAAEVVILPSEPKEDCYAYRIVREVLPEIDEKEIVCKSFPMIKDAAELDAAHNRIYQDIDGYLNEGKDVAFLTIGDPSVYSTYSYMHKRALAHGRQAVMISGVPSFCAAAARLGIPLGDGKEEIHVIPASYELEKTMLLEGTKVYMKSGKRLEELKQSLLKEASKKALEVYAVSNCGMPNERVFTGLENLDTESGYLTVVIVREKSAGK